MSSANSSIIISAFTEDQVERLAGVSKHQLRSWDRTGFFRPAYADENRRHAYSRIYSFTDIVCLQILGSLRNDMGISLQHLREVKKKLEHLGDDLWSKTKLYVVKRRVVFVNPDTQKKEEIVSGQRILEIPLKVVRAKMENAVRRINKRKQGEAGKVERHRRIARNAWVLSGTRIPTKAIYEFHLAGYSADQIIGEYPALKKEDIAAAIRHEEDKKAA